MSPYTSRDAPEKRSAKAIKEGSTWLQESKITRVQDYYMTMTMHKHYKEIISRGQNLIIATKA
jgi:hypothetical protein